MLIQVNHWMEILGTGVDLLLLARVLMLRLFRVYLFITLVCVLTVFFDGVSLWLGTGSVENFQVFLYSRFLWAVMYPLASWDVFEEVKGQITKLRRVAIGRLVSGLFFAAVFSMIFLAFVDTGEQNSTLNLTGTFGIILWAGSSTASLAFLWTIHRAMRAQNVMKPNNTSVWLIFYEFSLAAEILSCVVLLMPLKEGTLSRGIELAFLVYSIAVTVWCTVRLRPSSTNAEPASETART